LSESIAKIFAALASSLRKIRELLKAISTHTYALQRMVLKSISVAKRFCLRLFTGRADENFETISNWFGGSVCADVRLDSARWNSYLQRIQYRCYDNGRNFTELDIDYHHGCRRFNLLG
jgi:hypothetical protein